MERRRSRLMSVLGPARAPLLASGVALALAGGMLTLTGPLLGRDAGAPPRGVVHGWVSPTDSRALIPATVCRGDDSLTTLSLAGASRSRHGALPELVLEPPEVVVTGAAIDRGAEVRVLDVSEALKDHRPLASMSEPYTHATARCRSWSEHAWDLGALSVSSVDRPLRDGEPIIAYVVPQPTYSGLLALLMIHNYEVPVEIVSLELGAAGSTADTVLAASGWMEHWDAWEQEALVSRSERRLAPSRGHELPAGPGQLAISPPLEPTDPAPPLTWRRTDGLKLRLEPFNVAAIVIGEWTFGGSGSAPGAGLFVQAWHRLRALVRGGPEVVLTFPVITYRAAGEESAVGMTEPLYARLR